MKSPQRKAFVELAILTQSYPSFESICVAVMKNRGDKHTTGEAMNDLWWVWCETYPDDKNFNLINAEEKHLRAIIDYIKS